MDRVKTYAELAAERARWGGEHSACPQCRLTESVQVLSLGKPCGYCGHNLAECGCGWRGLVVELVAKEDAK